MEVAPTSVIGKVAGASAVAPEAPEPVPARTPREEPTGESSASAGKVEAGGRPTPSISNFKWGLLKRQWRAKDEYVAVSPCESVLSLDYCLFLLLCARNPSPAKRPPAKKARRTATDEAVGRGDDLVPVVGASLTAPNLGGAPGAPVPHRGSERTGLYFRLVLSSRPPTFLGLRSPNCFYNPGCSSLVVPAGMVTAPGAGVGDGSSTVVQSAEMVTVDAFLPARNLLPIVSTPSAGTAAGETGVTDPEMGTVVAPEGGAEERMAPDAAMSVEAACTRGADMAVGGKDAVPRVILSGCGEANPVVVDDPASRGGGEEVTDPNGGGVVGWGKEDPPPATLSDDGDMASTVVAGSGALGTIDKDAARVAREATAAGATVAAASLGAPIVGATEAIRASLGATAGGVAIGSTAAAEDAPAGDEIKDGPEGGDSPGGGTGAPGE